MSDQQPANAFADVAPPTSQMAADINAGFAFFLDAVVNMFVLAGILLGAFQFPVEVVFGKVIPGALAGLLVGNGMFIWFAKKTAKETGNEAITSIPLGIDLPTVFGMCFFILGPVYLANVEALGAIEAAEKAWVIGMAGTLWMAFIKFALSFVAVRMQQELPPMAMIGAMAGIATVWLGAEAIFGVFELPEVGIVSLIVMAYALIAGHRLPFSMPGAVIAILGGTVLYYILAFAGAGNNYVVKEAPELVAALPAPSFMGPMALFGDVTNYLGIILPFAILIAASSVNVIAGARVIGDTYDASKVVRIDSVATAVSALFGGVVQTTPYFGHATYKRMGARTNYAVGAVSVIVVGGFLGVIALASQMIPAAVLKPILVVVACDIMRLAFTGGDVRHAPALLFAIIPGVLNYTFTKLSDLYGRLEATVQQGLASEWVAGFQLMGAMSKGYILTSIIWGAMIVWIIDRKLPRAAAAAFVAALCTAFGIIHSVAPTGGMYLPWAIGDLGGVEVLPLRLAAGYLIAGLMLLGFNLSKNGAQE